MVNSLYNIQNKIFYQMCQTLTGSILNVNIFWFSWFFYDSKTFWTVGPNNLGIWEIVLWIFQSINKIIGKLIYVKIQLLAEALKLDHTPHYMKPMKQCRYLNTHLPVG